jgi:hypothetical protein
VFWSNIWHQRTKPIFQLGWLVPQVLFFCQILMVGLLSLRRIAEKALFRQRT